jgi:threonylcarbamoyladenosine tRNA methylthiotransferase MtaB
MQPVSAKAAFLTLGCRVNQSESSVIEGTLRENGVSIVTLQEQPDFCVINTCAVTGRSDAASRQLIRKAAKTGAKVIVTGCYSQLKRDEALGMEGVFAVVPVNAKEKIVGIILGREADTIYHLHDRARPYLKVQDGCNFSCSYCAVPLARGKSRSLPIDEAVRRAEEIDAQGYHEIVLTGIHLGSYGQDLEGRASLARLVREILSRTGIRRVRLSSLEINELEDDLLEVMEDSRVCRHLHLPLQSGSDKVLGLMRRNYSSDAFRKKVMKIAERFDDLSIGTDVIVGFPGEEEKDFLDTYQLIDELPFTYLHIFPYSPRPGTAASLMRPCVPNSAIVERADALKLLNSGKRERHTARQMRRTLDVIIEENDRCGYMSGTAGNYLKIRVRADGIRQGTLVYIRPAEIHGTTIRGFVIA